MRWKLWMVHYISIGIRNTKQVHLFTRQEHLPGCALKCFYDHSTHHEVSWYPHYLWLKLFKLIHLLSGTPKARDLSNWQKCCHELCQLLSVQEIESSNRVFPVCEVLKLQGGSGQARSNSPIMQGVLGLSWKNLLRGPRVRRTERCPQSFEIRYGLWSNQSRSRLHFVQVLRGIEFLLEVDGVFSGLNVEAV